MLPVINDFKAAHRLTDVTVVADAGKTGWSMRKFVRTARRYRTVQIRAARQIFTAADPLPNDLAEALAEINSHDVH